LGHCPGKGSGSREDLAGKLKQQAASVVGGSAVTGNSTLLLGVERDLWGSDASSPTERRRFDQMLERVLAQLEPVCLAEQNFCVAFFQLDVLSPSTKVSFIRSHNVPFSEGVPAPFL